MSARTLAALKAWDTMREADEAVTVNLPIELLPLWHRVKGGIRGETPHARYEAFMAYAGEHPSEAVAAMADSADAALEVLLLQNPDFVAERRHRAARKAWTIRRRANRAG